MLKPRAGFSLLEIFITIAIAVILIPGAYAMMSASIRLTTTSLHDVEAAFLSDEGAEAVRMIRNEGWTANIANKIYGTTYYPVLSGSSWSLTTANPGLINNRYTRTVVFASVSRDVNGDIVSSGGTLDPDTRQITVTTSWSERGHAKSVVVQAYITNYFNG
jgi:Tfp pilus assembly protein PilV